MFGGENMDDFSEEEAKTKGKMYALTTLSVIAVIIGFFVCSILLVKSCMSDITKNKFYILAIDDKNMPNVISLLENENYDYCESMYKIDYYRTFSKGLEIEIYCKDEKNMIQSIKNSDTSKLVDYIILNGRMEIK